MNDLFRPSRRQFLAAAACCAAAAPLSTPMTFAAVPGERRLVTIILRGAMDGLSLVQPYGDPMLKVHRPTLALSPGAGLLDLDGMFGLNEEANALLPLWQSGELTFVQGLSTPYRNERSHFDGQDVLESGGASVNSERTGWLNRALAAVPSAERRAIDVNPSADLLLSGPNPVDVWSSRTDLDMGADELVFLDRLYRNDPVFARALAEAAKTDLSADAIYRQDKRGTKVADIARLAGGMLTREYRIASFSLAGWDTHADQVKTFRKPAAELATAIVTLKQALGPAAWRETVVLAITEFGRTVRENGSAGTDHGTGSLAVVAGGAIRGGRMAGRFPGLAEKDLLDARDLAPTGDVRELAAAMLHRQFGITAETITNRIFPGLDFDRSSPLLKAI
ncbi:DUF1501 domain-containing protein [Ensifer soli]|uniref:DUF1501 domain-containing protein n=1 Tax=Ciceribacter sp. sgz301302 TaxID=3342379 RepID=UPI0035B88C1D